jgi:nickel-type superoxide dismutase maturation protease
MKKLGGAGPTTRQARFRRAPRLLAFGLLGATAVFSRVAVEGDSMRPTLESGDRLLVLRLWGGRGLRDGDLVTVRDPRPDSGRPVLVKRVARLVDGSVELAGDNPDASTDSRTFGRVPVSSVRGKVLYRYAPSSRTGVVH